MRKFFKIIISCLFAVIFYSGSISAADVGRASIYKVTMEELHFCEDSKCATYTKICDTEKTVDIAAVTAGSDVASWCPLTGLPIGTTFSHLRVKLNRAFTLAGVVLDKDSTTDCYTGGTNDATATKTANGSSVTNASVSGDTITIPGQTLEETVIWLYDARGNNGNYIDGAGSNTYWWSFYTHAGRPVGATSWCVGTTAGTHTNAANVCADTNTQSATWDDAASATTLQIIYPFSNSYTIGVTTPKATLSFDTSKGMGAEWLGASGSEVCEMTVGQVGFTATLSD